MRGTSLALMGLCAIGLGFAVACKPSGLDRKEIGGGPMPDASQSERNSSQDAVGAQGGSSSGPQTGGGSGAGQGQGGGQGSSGSGQASGGSSADGSGNSGSANTGASDNGNTNDNAGDGSGNGNEDAGGTTGEDDGGPDDGQDDSGGDGGFADEDLSYYVDVNPLLKRYCDGGQCHGVDSPQPFVDSKDRFLQADASRIEKGDMPPQSRINQLDPALVLKLEEELELIRAYLQQEQ